MRSETEWSDAMKREAAAMREPFSEPLHADVMRRVRMHRSATADRPPLRIRWAVAALATIAVVTGVSWMSVRARRVDSPRPIAPLAQAHLPALGEWLSDISRPIEVSVNDSLRSGGMNSIDGDVRSFGTFLADQFDTLPSPQPTAERRKQNDPL